MQSSFRHHYISTRAPSRQNSRARCGRSAAVAWQPRAISMEAPCGQDCGIVYASPFKQHSSRAVVPSWN
eukprot:11198615-Lingulodinium_polyedra.AAC.1